jgi:hypothetical protein
MVIGICTILNYKKVLEKYIRLYYYLHAKMMEFKRMNKGIRTGIVMKKVIMLTCFYGLMPVVLIAGDATMELYYDKPASNCRLESDQAKCNIMNKIRGKKGLRLSNIPI